MKNANIADCLRKPHSETHKTKQIDVIFDPYLTEQKDSAKVLTKYEQPKMKRDGKRLHFCRASLFIFGRSYFITALTIQRNIWHFRNRMWRFQKRFGPYCTFFSWPTESPSVCKSSYQSSCYKALHAIQSSKWDKNHQAITCI